MTEENKTLTESPEKFREYSTHLKHDLCKIYRFIENHKDSRANVNFDEHGVFVASMHTGQVTASEKYCAKFIANLENIKMLIDEEPFAKIKVKRSAEIGDTKAVYEYEETEVFLGYRDGDISYFTSKLKNSKFYVSHEIIEKRNIS